MKKIIASAEGDGHFLILTEDGEVWTWGDNEAGQLGNGNNKPCPLIGKVQGLNEKVVGIASGLTHSLALTEDGEVYSWGNNHSGQLGIDYQGGWNDCEKIGGFREKVVQIAAGYVHSMALTETGKLYTWGDNVYGQLGDQYSRVSMVPTIVNQLAEKITAIATGSYHCLALTDSGALYSWGLNGNGQLGDGTLGNQAKPVKATRVVDKIVKIAAGDSNSLVLTFNHRVFGWGGNNWGELGDTKKYGGACFFKVELFQGDVADIAAGRFATFMLTEKGEIYYRGEEQFRLKALKGTKRTNHVLLAKRVAMRSSVHRSRHRQASKNQVVLPMEIDPLIMISPFGRGGKVVPYTYLEEALRKGIGQEISL